MTTARIESLTVLRFVAAVIVVVYHFGRDTDLGRWAQPAIISGPQMVTFFFVLSGFVLTLAYYSRGSSPKAFYLSRAARIIPAYVLALGLFWLMSANSKEVADLGALFLHLTFLQSWFPAHVTTWNVPGWSLSVEAFLYLTFPLMLVLIKRSNTGARTLFGIALVTWLVTQVLLVYLFNNGCFGVRKSDCHDFVMYFPPFHLCSFLLGVSGGTAFVKSQVRGYQRGKMLVPIAASFALIVLLLQFPQTYEKRFGFTIPLEASLYGPPFLILILSVANASNALTRFLSLPPLVLLGNASYSLYILQVPIHKAFGKYIGSKVNWNDNQEFTAYLALLILVSIASFYVIEKPGGRLILMVAASIQALTHRLRRATSGSVANPA